jgi:hypothetical protein
VTPAKPPPPGGGDWWWLWRAVTDRPWDVAAHLVLVLVMAAATFLGPRNRAGAGDSGSKRAGGELGG